MKDHPIYNVSYTTQGRQVPRKAGALAPPPRFLKETEIGRAAPQFFRLFCATGRLFDLPIFSGVARVWKV